MITVKVPATSANMGPAYDCMGVALGLFNTITVEETEGGIEIVQQGAFARHVPTDERNLVYRSMKRVFDETGRTPRGIRLVVTSNIPSTRGLGSSAACIAGGMVAANAVYGMLSLSDILYLAATQEGHPDNVTPCLVGGAAAAVLSGKRVYYTKMALPQSLRFAVFSPEFTLHTKKARGRLPMRVSHADAVFNAGRSALLAASLSQGKWENLFLAMDDRLHQPYRKSMVLGMDAIFDACRKNGALGCYLSGAGPSLAAVVDKNHEAFESNMNRFLKGLSKAWTLRMLPVDNHGISVTKTAAFS